MKIIDKSDLEVSVIDRLAKLANIDFLVFRVYDDVNTLCDVEDGGRLITGSSIKDGGRLITGSSIKDGGRLIMGSSIKDGGRNR